jgi:hypothetical protein
MALCFVLCVVAVAAAEDPEAQSQLDVRVLYAGDAEAERTEDWREFLGPRVAAFEAIDRADLSAETAEGFDVVIVDAPSPYHDDGVTIPDGAPLDLEFSRPTILMGAAGGATLGPLGIKLHWL